MYKIILTLLLIYFDKCKTNQYVDSPLRNKYDGYGDDWIFIPDGNNKPQVAVLKGQPPPEFRSLIDESVTFHLFTRNQSENATMLVTGNPESIKNSSFNPSYPTKFITHGWKSSALSSGPTNLKNAFLKKGNYNVILVDWEPLASSTFYLGPMQNTGNVGKEAAKFIDYLLEQTGQSPDKVHFIGHSLGAHVAGNAASSVKRGKIGRVTGLDPALPGFHVLESNDGRLDASDAKFVDVIHSCGGILGYLNPLGTVDFYPNAGVAVQPGCCCVPEILEACSHGRAYVYYTESLTSNEGLLARQCESWDKFEAGECNNSSTTYLGENVDQTAKGTYWLKTNAQSPFAPLQTNLLNQTMGKINNTL